MAAVVLEIADAVVAALNAATLGQTFTAERLYVPVFELQDLTGLKVSVVAPEYAGTPLTRGGAYDYAYTVQVGIQRRVDGTNADVDPLVLFAQAVADLFRGKRLDGYEAASCTNVAVNPVYDPALMDEKRVFLSVVALTFRLAR